MKVCTQDDWLIEAGKMEPGDKLVIVDPGSWAARREFIDTANQALRAQYGKDNDREAYWHGRIAICRHRAARP